MRCSIIEFVAELRTEIIRHDLPTCGVNDIDFVEGVIVRISREVEVQGEIAIHHEGFVKVGESVDEVVEEWGVIELELEFCEKVGDIIGTLSDVNSGRERAFDFRG